MFHLELRQFPHVARAFNLTAEELRARILIPWVQGNPVLLDGRQWRPERAKLTIYEGRMLETDEIGMGRGWGNVTRSGQQVTERLLAETHESLTGQAAGQLKDRLLERALAGAITLPELVELTPAEDSRRPSERLAVAEQTVWELLHEGRVRLVRGGTTLGPEEWPKALLSWRSWTEGGAGAVSVAIRGR